MPETCNSRSFSWLVRSCMPDPNPIVHPEPRRHRHLTPAPPLQSSSLYSLPDDLLIECLSRLPLSSLPSVSLACRRFSLLLDTPAFLLHRRELGLLSRSLLAVCVSDIGLLSYASYPTSTTSSSWQTLPYPIPLPPHLLDGAICSFSNARLVTIGRSIYALGRAVSVRYDTWTESAFSCSPTLFPRKKFAAAVVDGRIYVAGGTARTAIVEEYDPCTDKWNAVTEAPRKRYGCVGAASNGVFYVIGGLKIGGPVSSRAESAHTYASTMDALDTTTGTWLRTRAVPGGGCIIGACAAGPNLYVLASHAVEVSFWRLEAATKKSGGSRGMRGGGWERLRSPSVPGQVHVRGALRFSCVGVGEKNVVVVVQLSESSLSSSWLVGDGTRSMPSTKEGMVLWYDVDGDEWFRGTDLPPSFQRSAFVCVDC